MQRVLISLIRVMPLWVLYFVMALVVPFYMCRRSSFLASYRFYRRRMGYPVLKSFLHVYSNHFNMGMVVLDRFAVYAGKQFDVQILRKDLYETLADGKTGFLMLSSHTGCFEMVGYTWKSSQKVNALVFPGETSTMTEQRGKVFNRMNVKMIPVQGDFSHVFAVNNALADGEVVCMPGDRLFGSQKSLRIPFFGEEAAFPAGPFLLSAQRGAPILSAFVMKTGYMRYRVYLEQLPEHPGLERDEQARLLAEAYAARLESVVREYPDQWYNFYDFWE